MGAKRSIVKENKNGRQNSQNAEKRSRKRKNPKAVRQLTAIYVALVLAAAGAIGGGVFWAVHSTRVTEELIAENAPITQLKPGELIVRLSYTERNTSEALISSASRQFEIDINIIFANIESVQGAPIGGTVAIISGARERITAAIAYLIEKNVGVEVLKDARVA